ncbi:MAG: hypothetical protein U9R39_09805 [Campylobacterota bacterium]|nr:hypothetical protein [Campylobacterota bacterium]
MKLKIMLLLSLVVNSLATEKIPYIITDSEMMDQRAILKIKEIGDEVKSKFNINLYIDIKGNNGIDLDLHREQRVKLMKMKEKALVKDLVAPYAVLTLAIDQMYASILMSDDLKGVIDKDDVLGGYVIPLLASKDKNTLMAKASAASLNGFAQMADSIAKSKNVKLASSIGSEGKVAGTIWKVFMYTLVVTGIVLYIVIIMREKKYKNMTKEELEEDAKK